MSFVRPFCGITSLAVPATAAFVLLAPALMLPARTRPSSRRRCPALPNPIAQERRHRERPAPAMRPPSITGAAPPQTRTKAIQKAKDVVKSPRFSAARPSPKGRNTIGSLPHVAGKLASGAPVTIIAFGSSSTQGWGSTSPEFTYPNRLAAQLHRQYPSAEHHRGSAAGQ